MCVQPLLPWGDMLRAVRFLCCQQSTNHFSKACNLAKFGQIFLDTANSIFLLQRPPPAKFQAFSSSLGGMQALQKEKVHQDVIQRQFSLKLSEVLASVWQYLRQTLGMENTNLNCKSPTTLQNQIKTCIIISNVKVFGH